MGVVVETEASPKMQPLLCDRTDKATIQKARTAGHYLRCGNLSRP